MYGMKRRESIPLRRRLGFRSKGRRRRSLSCGKGIVFIVTGNMHKRQISPRSMEQMPKSDPITIDLYSPEYHQDYLKFDENGKPIINKETLIMQSKVKWADEIVFIFPIWRFDMPAILKNWLDTTMTSGFAYKHKV